MSSYFVRLSVERIWFKLCFCALYNYGGVASRRRPISCFSLENAIFELMNVKGSMISPILDDMFNLLYSKKL